MKQKYSLFLFGMDMARAVLLPLKLVFRTKRRTPEGEKYQENWKGGAILAANHTAFTDPFVALTAFFGHRVFFLAAEAVMKGGLRSALLKAAGCIKVDRNSVDLEAIKECVGRLKEGNCLLVFPQGAIVQEGEMADQLKNGSALMAIQAGVPIIPMHITPVKGFFARRTVTVGQPINPKEICQKKIPSLADISAVTEKLTLEMNRCAKSSQGN